MIRLLRSFGLLFWINAGFFGALALFSFTDLTVLLPGGQLIRSALILGISFLLPGQNLAALLEHFSQNRWTRVEKAVVAFVLSLVVPPLTITLVAPFVDGMLAAIPIILAALSWIAAVKWHPAFWEQHQTAAPNPHWIPGCIIASILWGVFVLQFVSAYYALPDLDPYYWLQKFQQDFSHNSIVLIGLHRPLFSSFGYITFQTSGVDLYAFFKYLLPFCLLGALAPMSLIASRARSLGEAILAFALPAASGSFLLYTLASLPQSIANLLIMTALLLVAHAILARQIVFFWLAGAALFGATLYHEMSLLFLLIWIGCSLWLSVPKITSFSRERWIITVLLSLLFISYFGPSILSNALFLESWSSRVLQAIINHQPNWAFPATYINIDGQAVGWSDWWGVARYYLFYLGPLALGLLTWILWTLVVKQSKGKQYLFPHEYRFDIGAIAFLMLSALIFLIIAEILPRLFNLALLPERAIGFFSLTLVPIGYILLFRSPVRLSGTLTAIAIAAVLANAGGALYINSIKQYLVTSNHIASAEWIRGALPEERAIITGTHTNLLQFHAQTRIVISVTDPALYSDIRVFDLSLSKLPSKSDTYEDAYFQLIQTTESFLSQLNRGSTPLEYLTLSDLLTRYKDSTDRFLETYHTDSTRSAGNTRTPVYIYYAKENEKNPYANRPYLTRRVASEQVLIFDQYPERFKRIYSLPGNEIVIWELIQ